MNRILAAAALLACFACAKTETDFDKATSVNENGKVYGYIAPLNGENPNTRAYWVNSEYLPFQIELNDKVNVWTPKGTHMEYMVSEILEAGHFALDTEEFDLKPGVTYTAGFPWLPDVTNSATAQPITYEGQTQTDQSGNELRDLAKYIHLWAVSPCDENGNTSFEFNSIGTILKVIITLPREGMTINEVKLTADKPVFALNGTANFTTGAFTPTGDLSESLTMDLEDVTVNGNVLTAFFASAPLAAAKYVISVKEGSTVYKSTEIALDACPAHSFRVLENAVAPVGGYVKVTSMPADPAGKYILVYPSGTTYRAFSFAKTMENAEAAAASVATVSGIENLYNQSSTLYNTVVGGNYVEITGEANATALTLNPEQEAAAAITIAANASPWTVTAPAKDLQTTLTSGSYSLGVDHLVANVASDGKADLVAAFNAPNAVAIMNDLRGHEVNVTFAALKQLALEKVDDFDATEGSLDDEFLTKAFNKLVAAAKDIVEDNPHNLFPAGSSLNITLSTNAFDVFKQYHDNAAEISWRISPEKRFGLAQLGYNENANGFTASVDLPSYEWFYTLNESLNQARKTIVLSGNSYPVADRDLFVNYWKNFDTQYTVKIDGVKINNFFEKLANRLLSELAESPIPTSVINYLLVYSQNDEFFQLVAAATPTGGEKFKKLGDAYKKFAEKLVTGIQPAYIYKKVQ